MTPALSRSPSPARMTRPMVRRAGSAISATLLALAVLAAVPPAADAAPPSPVRARMDPVVDAAYEAYLDERYTEAADGYERAARAGHPVAQFNLAMMLKHGEGRPQDDCAAERWLRKAARQGMPLAEYTLGLAYEYGEFGTKSNASAHRWYEAAARKGHVDAQVALGTQYLLGRGAAQSDRLAARWYRRAAQGGDVAAQYIMGSFYERGTGLPRDEGAAIGWYRKAAAQGDLAAAAKVQSLTHAQ